MQQSFKLLFTVATMQLNDIFHQFEVPEAKVQHGDEAHQINDNARGCEKCNVVAYSKDPLFCQLLISLSMVPPGGTQPGGFVPAVKVTVAIKIATVIIVFLALCRASSDGCSSKSSFHTGCALDVGKRPQDSMTREARWHNSWAAGKVGSLRAVHTVAYIKSFGVFKYFCDPCS
ncbi:hypothetical protein Pint_10319 [Pistacia integerrima]|uniref:Uncharacterized protein n=1 Tax=Pistacia integerrima TaxID=434235 RepID=A0ACC0XJD0_9ROSI|nr:hypothetical protein Pint_10319 [Pistacia integerrima]